MAHRHSPLVPLVALAATLVPVAAGPAPAPEPAAPRAGSEASASGAAAPQLPQGTARDFDALPPGSAEDQALWQAGREASERIILDRVRATGLQAKADAQRYLQRLEDLSRQPGAPAGALAAREALLQAWSDTYEVLARQWPVDPTRGCRYEVLNFETALHDDDPIRRAATLGPAREQLLRCVEKARVALSALQRSVDRFQAAVEKAEALLGATADSPRTAGGIAGDAARGPRP